MNEKVDLLLVEDSPNDAHLVERAIKVEKLNCAYKWLQDGESVLQYLQQTTSDLPKLILLDVKMPKMSGIEVLNRIRKQPHLKYTPIIMLSSSNQQKDIRQAYDYGANGYLVKPDGYSELKALIREIYQYWLLRNQTTYDS